MSNKDAELAEQLNQRLTVYFSHENGPVRFLRAETDLLVRMVVSQSSVIAAHIRALESIADKKRHSTIDLLDKAGMNMMLTDLALLNSIAQKLRDSE